MTTLNTSLAEAAHDVVLSDIDAEGHATLPDSNATWQKVRELGSELWLDTGDVDEISQLWTKQFAALTTNNSLLNKEVQKGTYDELIPKAARAIREAHPGIEPQQLIHEIAFILNARHGLKLVRHFDANVSVELHTDLAHDAEASYAYGLRYVKVCPEHFTVKVPLTAAGLVAAGRLSRDGVRVNFTLGFSARENMLIALVAQPRYCNVFLGRLNQVAEDNGYNDGSSVGERATAISHRTMRMLRDKYDVPTEQIAASLRNGEQIAALLGVDVLTMPPKAAQGFLDLGLEDDDLKATIEGNYQPEWNDPDAAKAAGFDTLWDVPEGFAKACWKLADRFEGLTGQTIQSHLADQGFGDVLPQWSDSDIKQATDDGKIPKIDNWADRLTNGEIGLDALMTLHGLQAFAGDQKKMDDRIREHLD